jgi:DNA repair protein RecO
MLFMEPSNGEQVDGIILRRKERGEGDSPQVVLTLFTLQYGKVKLRLEFNSGVSQFQSELLIPTTRVRLLVDSEKNASLRRILTVEQWDDYRSYWRKRIVLPSYSLISEMIERVVPYEQANPRFYNMLDEMLRRFAHYPDDLNYNLYYQFKTFELLGFGFQLKHCVRCGEGTVYCDQFFSFRQGGVVCPACLQDGLEDCVPASAHVLAYLAYIQTHGFEAVHRAHFASYKSESDLHALMWEYRKFAMKTQYEN